MLCIMLYEQSISRQWLQCILYAMTRHCDCWFSDNAISQSSNTYQT